RKTKDLGRLRDGHSGEVAEFDELRRLGIDSGQASESGVQGDKVVARIGRGWLCGIQVDAAPISAMLVSAFPASRVHQNPAHGLGRGSEEMAAIVPPIAVSRANQTDVSFMDESGRLKGIARWLGRQSCSGKAAKLLVDQRQQLLGDVGLALAHCV